MYKILSTCRGGGYMYCRTDPPHPRRNTKGLYPLHRVIAENKIGRSLGKREHVHHIDGDKWNNTEDNLEILSISDHGRHHHPRELSDCVCAFCGSMFRLKSSVKSAALKRSVSGKIYCSYKCCGKSKRRGVAQLVSAEDS